jgi:hypothetical protein
VPSILFSIPQVEETLQEVEEVNLLEDVNQEDCQAEAEHQAEADRQVEADHQVEEDIPLPIQGNKHHLCHHRLQAVS